MLPGATVTPIDVPAWLDVLTVVVAALGGALFASRRQVTVTGVLLVAVCVGLGGGMIRDVLLDVAAPKALSDPIYLPAAGVAAVCGMLLAKWSNRIAVPMLLWIPSPWACSRLSELSAHWPRDSRRRRQC